MPPIRPELLDELLKDYQKPEDLLGQDGLLQQLTKALVERALDGELTHHLGYEKRQCCKDYFEARKRFECLSLSCYSEQTLDKLRLPLRITSG